VTVRGEGTTVDGDGEGADEEQTDDEPAVEADEATQADETGSSERDASPASTDAASPAETSAPEPSGGEPAGDVDSGSFEPDMEMDDLAADESATTEDFAEMFEQSGAEPEQRDYETGDHIEGEIIEIGDRYIFVQLDPQTEGAAKRREFENEEGELEMEFGETREFYVTDVDTDEIYLGEQLEGNQGSIDAIVQAHENGVPVEGKVTGTNKGGFEVEIHGVDAFCPISQIELGFTEDKEAHVGATYRFKVSEVEDGGDTVVVSRAELLQEERAEKAKQTLESLEEGQVVEGIITRTTGFGAFVDLGGVEGLVHISELSHRTFDQASEVVEEGETVEVEILDIELPDDEDDDPRISLSRKSTESDPWATVNEKFAVGESVEGDVVRNAPFGSFVEIAPGVEGLVHVSEMSWTEHVKTPDDVVEPGEKVTVRIQDIDIADRRLSLSMREAEGHPWDDVRDEYQVGAVVEGEVENIEDFGVFVKLPTGITALIPRSEMSLPSGATPFRVFNEGERVEARILNIDEAERKMALTPIDDQGDDGEASEEGDEDEITKTPTPDEASDTGGGFGTLGDMVGDQLQGDEE